MSHLEEVGAEATTDVDLEKRQWLQALRLHDADSAPVEPASPAEIMADFIRQHTAAGQLVARALFLQPPYSMEEAELAPLLAALVEGRWARISRVCTAPRRFISTQRAA